MGAEGDAGRCEEMRMRASGTGILWWRGILSLLSYAVKWERAAASRTEIDHLQLSLSLL